MKEKKNTFYSTYKIKPLHVDNNSSLVSNISFILFFRRQIYVYGGYKILFKRRFITPKKKQQKICDFYLIQ